MAKISKTVYVTPDPPMGDEFHEDRYSTLAIYPEYRVALHFFRPDVSLLFPGDGYSWQDRVPRLHALNYYNKPPISKAKEQPRDADLKDSASNVNKWRLKDCEREGWNYFRRSAQLKKEKEHLKKCALDEDEKKAIDKLKSSDAMEILELLLGVRILEGGKLPKPGAEGRIFFPGERQLSDKRTSDEYFGAGSSGSDEKGWDSMRYLYERKHLEENRSLGLIPLVAKVEKRYPKEKEWRPAEGAEVYFQLVDPDPEPNPPATPTNGEKFVQDTIDYYAAKAKSDDPQRGNAPAEAGGKQGNPVGGKDRLKNVFLTDIEIEGFHKPPVYEKEDEYRDSRKTKDNPQGQRKNYAMAKRTGEYPHAVRAVANENGEAGVLFMPAACGGDRYKIRAFVGPPSQYVSPEDLKQLKPKDAPFIAETGTLVVWRTSRVAQVLVPDYSTPAKIRELGEVAVGGMSLWAKEYEKGYTHVEFDCDKQQVMTATKDTTPGQWQAAHTAARNYMKANPGLPKPIDCDKLIPANIDPASDNFVQLVDRATYNTAAANDKQISYTGAGISQDDMHQFYRTMMTQLMMHFTKDGLLPGVTLIRALNDCVDDYKRYNIHGTAILANGCYCYGSIASYKASATDAQNKNGTIRMLMTAVHELGHTGFLHHQVTGTEGEAEKWTKTEPVLHLHEWYHNSVMKNFLGMAQKPIVSGKNADKICMMSYHTDRRHLCGKCLLALRGWNVARVPKAKDQA